MIFLEESFFFYEHSIFFHASDELVVELVELVSCLRAQTRKQEEGSVRLTVVGHDVRDCVKPVEHRYLGLVHV